MPSLSEGKWARRAIAIFVLGIGTYSRRSMVSCQDA